MIAYHYDGRHLSMICASVVWYNLYLANQQVHLVAVHLLHVSQISAKLFHLRDDSGGRGGGQLGKGRRGAVEEE